ncbi:hypothetical protein GRI34_06140 [Erythrobacter aquimaris]|uniref:Uncharacterized protein n=1 Tax=Qipengyuania aquimaris TaxID=255984 RepID=A0A6I4TIZ1_9SPHN|nr:hypothetical protein [Qipengyuania aquimaris]MXO96002.1 hypothetical protein [Qipengyuania aquimaris]
MARFIRIATIGFSLFSVLFWTAASMVFEIVKFSASGEEKAAPGYLAGGAIPTILYGLICAIFLQWFARGIIKRMRP